MLRPVEPTPALDWLAAQCVATFEDFAAPPSETEREEHAAPHLNDYQRLLLESFGDPNVLSEYRFSITLTGPLDDDASRARGAGAVAGARGDLRLGRDRRRPVAVRRYRRPRADAADRPLRSARKAQAAVPARGPGQSFDTRLVTLFPAGETGVPCLITRKSSSSSPRTRLQFAAERELHASLLELIAKCLRSDSTDRRGGQGFAGRLAGAPASAGWISTEARSPASASIWR